MEYKSELKKIKNLVSSDTWDCLQANNAIIAGGAITSVFCNREVNDIDVYFRCEDDFISFIEEVYAGSHFLIVNNMTDRSILFKDKKTQQDVQVIVYKWFKSIPAVFADYDFTINMGAIACHGGQFVLHYDFIKHNSQRYLCFNEGTAYPLISALRVQKYIERGYTISKAQMLRLLLAVNAKQIDSWEKLKDEVGGMYGLNMDEVFDEKQPFSLASAMDTLSNLDYDGTYKMGAKQIKKEQIYAAVLAGKQFEDATGKFFKCVRKSAAGLTSFYASDFHYEVGSTVNGGARGIWFCNDYDVFASMHYHRDDAHIVELIGEAKRENKWTDEVLVGDVQVVASYSKMEFIKKYGYKEE